MTTIRVTISNTSKAKILMTFLRTLGYVKDVSIEEDLKPLTAEDWILPGRPATEAEIDALIEEMENDADEGYTTEEMESFLEEWKKKTP